MAKRDVEPEALEEAPTEAELPTVGEQLRAAREKQGLSLDDIAAQTRIPKRHLESLEKSEWDSLPAPTYTTGFAKSYAGAVGLDRNEIGDQLRAEMGGQRFTTNATETFEPADPRRTMPKWLVIGAIVAVILLVALMSWLNQRSLQQPDDTQSASTQTSTAPVSKQTSIPAASVAAQGPVVINATDAVWMQVSDRGGATLYSGVLQAGQSYTVPATAQAPTLKTAKSEALRITVGNQVAPPVGPPAKKVTVSLLPADLMKGGAAAPTAAPPPAAGATPAVREPRQKKKPAPAAPAAAPPAETAPAPSAAATNSNTGE